jgi:8-oxo-dGTP pyrophosphatase MutT (NUDIX family)
VAGDGRRSDPLGRRWPAATRGDDVVDELRPGRRPTTLVAGPGVARLKQATATSAGGIVIRYRGGAPQLVVGRRSRAGDGMTWTLPKGTPNASETREETALREVREETGLDVRIVRPFDDIEYTFIQRRTRIHKTVHYFLMVPTGGDLGRHDHEFDEVRWIGFDEAATLLTFDTERALVARAGDAATDGSFPVAADPEEPAP